MRTLFGLSSTNFNFIQSGDEIEIVTTGNGHGVGMSQYGANGMAKEGFNYKQILKHYYLGVEVVQMK
jgi:stage II sporulation protein D